VQQGTGAAYAGLRIGYLPRNSTPRQDGNYSQKRQRYLIADHIVAGGGTPVPYDEGIASGRDLGKRPAAQLALEHVASGELHGLAWEKLDRTTRDEYGADAAVIAEQLVSKRALLVTLKRDYRLWRTDDLREYRERTGDAGIEMLEIRDRLWAGVLEKAKEEPFFMGVPPYAYTTVLKPGRGGGAGQRSKINRVPMRDETCAPAMAELEHLMRTATGLGEVAAILNSKGLFRKYVAGELAGAPSQWRTEDSDGTSSIWENSPAGANAGGRIPTLTVDRLAWFTPEQLAAWRERFPRKADKSGPRHRKNFYPLRDVLHCASCNGLLVGWRAGLYGCSKHNSRAMDRLCQSPQFLSEAGAVRALIEVLPDALREVKFHRQELWLAATDDDQADALRRKRDVRLRQIEALTDKWYGDESDGIVPDAVVRRLKSWQVEVNELSAQVDRRDKALAVDPDRDHLIDAILEDPATILAAMPEAERMSLLRLVFSEVRIAATGWGSGRSFAVAHYHNQLIDSSIDPGSAGAPTVYHTILRWMGVRE
jgi:hypothetical protein